MLHLTADSRLSAQLLLLLVPIHRHQLQLLGFDFPECELYISFFTSVYIKIRFFWIIFRGFLLQLFQGLDYYYFFILDDFIGGALLESYKKSKIHNIRRGVSE